MTINRFLKLTKLLARYLQIRTLENKDQIKSEIIKIMIDSIEDDEKVENNKVITKCISL